MPIMNDEIFKIIDNFEGGYDYNYSYLDEGYEDMQRIENGYATFTTVDTQKYYNGSNNIVVDISECEELIKRDNGLEENDNIYMKKIDIQNDNMRISRIYFDIYTKSNSSNITKINLLIYSDKCRAYLVIPLTIKEENLDKLNSSSGYYNDII